MTLPLNVTQLLEGIPDTKSKYAISRAMDALQGTSTIAGLTAVITGLPTTLPGTSGQLWLNGGILSVS